jgi:CHAT domain-containing protein/tetratricopeptide (TPR) repeat protein
MTDSELLAYLRGRLRAFDAGQHEAVLDDEVGSELDAWRQSAPARGPVSAELLRAIAWTHWYRYLALPGDEAYDYAAALEYFTALSEASPEAVPRPMLRDLAEGSADGSGFGWLARVTLQLGEARPDRELEDVGHGIRLLAGAIAARPPADPARAVTLARLSIALRERFERTGDLADLNQAVTVSEQAVRGLSGDDPGFPLQLCSLSNALKSRFEQTGNDGDLDRAVTLSEQAVQVSAPDDPLAAVYLSKLAADLWSRFRHAGDLADLDRAISAGERAVQASPPGDPNLAAYLSDLSGSLTSRFEHTGQIADLDRAIGAGEQAMGTVSPDNPGRAVLLTGYGAALRIRFEHAGEPADLDRALAASEESVRVAADDERPMCLSNLGNVLQARYENAGNLADLDRAIALGEQAVQGTPPGHVELPDFLSNLGNRLRERFEQTGELADLDQAIRVGTQASGALAPGHPSQPVILFNLLGARLARYQRTENLADLNLAVELGERALRACPPGHRYRAGIMSTHSGALRSKFEHTGDKESLDRAIELTGQAIESTEPGQPDLPAYFSNRGVLLLDRYKVTADPADLEQAVAAAEQAARATPDGHPSQARHLQNLGLALRRRFERTGRPADQERALQAWSTAAQATSSPAGDRLLSARRQADAIARSRGLADALPAYEATMRLLPLLAWRGVGQEDQRHLLESSAAALGSDAAACAIAAGQLARAVELLEQGRGVLWAQLLETRSDLTGLELSYPELARELAECRATLDQLARSAAQPPADRSQAAGRDQRTAADRKEAARRFDALVAQVRALPATEGFPQPEAFLRPPPFEALRPRSAEGNVVIVNISQLSCAALAVSRDSIIKIELPGLTDVTVYDTADRYLDCLQRFEQSQRTASDLRELETGITAVLEWLWDHIARPVLDTLGYDRSRAEGWPRLWWCPTAALTLLPLHAAGYHAAAKGETVYDRVISSYVTTLRAHALAGAGRTGPRPPGNMLVVSLASTPGQSVLVSAADERRLLAGLFGERATILADQAATRAQILSQLSRHDWLHASCHGTQDLARPDAAGLVPYDWQTSGLIGITDLTADDQIGGQFAFLSACKTAIGGAANLDEAITLTAAMQYAGWQHVIGTLWTIWDRTSLAVTNGVYARLAHDGVLAPAPAAEALHHAVRQLRQEYPRQPSLWAPFIHLGP